ncbi:hypothetical protein PIB30_050335 [Stylosanthes scabra]|uniref:Uncharacterized protein n=1 Tax=Stylosanthes scabra TaxID=79078 RepID=A0ABU6UGZ5_9FABA|nr:hypothetical protein [Stylosanthes scabra]
MVKASSIYRHKSGHWCVCIGLSESIAFFGLFAALFATASSVRPCQTFVISSLPSSSNDPSLPSAASLTTFTRIRSFGPFPSEIDIRPSLAALFTSTPSLSPFSSALATAPLPLIPCSQAATTTDEEDEKIESPTKLENIDLASFTSF